MPYPTAITPPPQGGPHNPNAATSSFPSGVPQTTPLITLIGSSPLSQVALQIEQRNPELALDFQYVLGQLEDHVRQLSQQRPQSSGLDGQSIPPSSDNLQPPPSFTWNSPPLNPDSGAHSPHSRCSSLSDRSGQSNFGSQHTTTTPQPNTTPYESSGPHTPFNFAFPPSRALSRPHAYAPSAIRQPLTVGSSGPSPSSQSNVHIGGLAHSPPHHYNQPAQGLWPFPWGD